MKKILIIDDDKAIVDMVKTLLDEPGREVLGALNGADGFRLACETKPDLLIVDLMMPGEHGFDVVQKARKHEDLKGVKIMILSAKRYEVDKRAAMRLGADSYVTKPFHAKEFLEAVSEMLGPE